MGKAVQSWTFDVRDGSEPAAKLLDNGDRVPLPPSKMWSGGAHVSIAQMDDDGKKSYYVTITRDKYNQDEHKHFFEWVTGIAPGKLAQGGAMKVGLTLAGGLVGGILRVVASIITPTPIAKQSIWQTQMADGVPVTSVLIGF